MDLLFPQHTDPGTCSYLQVDWCSLFIVCATILVALWHWTVDIVFMKVTAEAIPELMLFCQHVHKAMNCGLESGLLDHFEAIIWLTAANFPPSGSSWSVPSKTCFQPGPRHLNLRSFTFSGNSKKNYYSRRELYESLFKTLWIKTNC